MAKSKATNIDDSAMILELEKNFKSMRGVPTRNLKLRHLMAKYLLKLVLEDGRRVQHGWYVDPLRRIMIDDLGTRLQQIVRELEGK